MMMGAISSLVAAHPIGASAARARIAENAGAKSVVGFCGLGGFLKS